ncbi:hypothetical protein SAMD00023353_10300130 [Rosellinia necatrix]|uniref:DUF7708 domain-containing protein n=1 Tax=Rosellinia necatrix TaxID=77044 RepID=A0A1W2TXI4_ROSNE|nr:hypothetical protein SAMD00023353_10300130 [Rosellinia necatrix]
MDGSPNSHIASTSQLVRSFSHDQQRRATGDVLTRGLAAKIAADTQQETNAALLYQWNHFLLEGRDLAKSIVPDEEVLLRDQSCRLYKAWNSFCQRLPDDQQKAASDEVPSLKLLHKSVSQAANTWKEERENTKIGRAKRIFTRLCENFDSHSNLISILPNNNTYVTLLTGSLTAIAQASINHQELADGVSSTLDELSQDIAYWNELIREYSDTTMVQRYIRDLYVVVFEFLTEIFSQWSKSSWRRFLTSFDEQALNKLFSEKQDRIRAIERRMGEYANLEFEHNTTKNLNANMTLQDEIKLQQDQMAADIREMKTRQNELIYLLGQNISQLLAQKPGTPATSSPTPKTKMVASGTTFKGSPLPSSHQTCNILELVNLLDPIVAKYARDIQHVVNAVARASQAPIQDRVKRRIGTWTKSSRSDAIWLQGPYERTHPSHNTSTAVCLVALANNNKIPCLSYFCSLGIHGTREAQSLTCQDMLMDLVKSLIVQLLLLLPGNLKAGPGLERSRFERLLGPKADVAGALSLFCDLRALAPPYMHCVIDAAQGLEDRGDLQHMQNLFRVLRAISGPAKASRHGSTSQRPAREGVIKTCIASDGYAEVLAVLTERGHLEKLEYDADEFVEDGPGLVARWDYHNNK